MEGQAVLDFVPVNAEAGSYCISDGNGGSVALLVSGNQTGGASMATLQEAVPATQFFIEQLSGGQARLQMADGQMIEIDVEPSGGVVGLMEDGTENGMPVLLRVAEDGTLLPDLSMVPTVQPVSEAVSHQDSSSTISIQEGAESSDAFPPGMYIEVHKETEDTAPGGAAVSGEGTALAIVTPEGEESDTEDPPSRSDPSAAEVGVDRLEDFMDVVTTYRCKFCRFSCAWKSGLMSHFRSCHVASGKGPNGKALPVLSARPLQQSRASAAPAKKLPQAEEIILDLPSGSAPAQPADKLGQALQMIQENLVDEPLVVNAGVEEDAQERHIFICGQCSQGFSSLDECKQHMMQAHELKAATEGNNSAATATSKKSPGVTRKRGRPSNSAAPKKRGGKAAQGQQQDTAASCLAAIHAGFKQLDTDDAVPEEEGNSTQKDEDLKDMDDDFLVQPLRKKRAKREGSNERLFKCSQKRGDRSCGYRFRTEEKLEYHIRCHAPLPTSPADDSRPFHCVECGEYFDHWRGLAMHLWRSHEFDLDLHSCTHCPYKTFSLFKLDNHMRIHSSERDFTCAQCGKGFKQLSQLRNHHVVHLDRKNMTHKRWYSEQTCDLCQRTFSDSKCLRKHQQAVHNKVKPYVCTVCGHMSARKAMLQLHLRQHTGEKPFACNVCDYRTGDHNSLRRHKMRHSGTKPYKCPHCPYACIQAISYKTHMKNKHPGLEGLYACPLCNFRSVSKENYVNHMSDHKNGILAPAATGTADGGQVIGEGSLQQQLEGLLPGNLSAAQLIYSCLSALQQQQEGGNTVTQLPPGVTSYSAGDGTHTITIQVPPSDLDPSLLSEQDQFFLTVQQQEDGALSYLSTAGDGTSVSDSYIAEVDAPTSTSAAAVSILKVNAVQD